MAIMNVNFEGEYQKRKEAERKQEAELYQSEMDFLIKKYDRIKNRLEDVLDALMLVFGGLPKWDMASFEKTRDGFDITLIKDASYPSFTEFCKWCSLFENLQNELLGYETEPLKAQLILDLLAWWNKSCIRAFGYKVSFKILFCEATTGEPQELKISCVKPKKWWRIF